MKVSLVVVAVVASLALVGCANTSCRVQNTAKGAAIGAVGGAGLGAVAGGLGVGAGAAAGAVGGAATGFILTPDESAPAYVAPAAVSSYPLPVTGTYPTIEK